ncbi:MAG: hypothetical protein KGJ01_03085 [Patescibacteria group bacterium]|nr:hypothetical protein [Patescibacteria group bacterium]
MPELTPLEKQWKQEPTMWISIGFTSLMVALALVYIYGMHKKLPSFLSPNQPGKCAVLPARYCDKEKPVTYPNNQTYLGFNISKNSYVYAPFDGMFAYSGVGESDSSLKTDGWVTESAQGNNIQDVFNFVAEFKPLVPNGDQVTKGEAVAQVDGNVIDEVSNSDLLINFSTIPPQYPSPDILGEYFKGK